MTIDRKTTISNLETNIRWIEDIECHQFPGWGNVTMAMRDAVELLKEQESVIRCKDCKHATMTNNGKMCKYCAMDTDNFGYLREVYHDADWFCAYGKRKSAE